MKADEIWQAALGELQLEMTRATFETWVRPTSLMSYEDGRFAIAVPNAYAQEWLQNRLLSTVKRVLTGITGRSVEVKFVVWNKEEKKEPVTLLNGMDQNTQPNGNGHSNGRALQSSGLNPRYVFDTFVVGNSNRLAHAACQAVAERPAAQYNPLFLYGGVGLGKTHLASALAHEACQRGAILVNGQVAKPAKQIQSGDQIQWRQPSRVLTLRVARIPGLPPGKKEASSLFELIKTEWLPRES